VDPKVLTVRAEVFNTHGLGFFGGLWRLALSFTMAVEKARGDLLTPFPEGRRWRELASGGRRDFELGDLRRRLSQFAHFGAFCPGAAKWVYRQACDQIHVLRFRSIHIPDRAALGDSVSSLDRAHIG
jgi:hypothetical protein